MRQKILMILSLTLIIALESCNSKTEESKPELSEWQKNVMLSENLPLDEEQLTESQKARLNSIFEMENYLREKYNEEFVYIEYWPAELLESEKLIVYPQMTGDGNGKNIVTVKREQNGKLTDDYFDYSVAEYAEKLTDDFLLSNFSPNDYSYEARTNACEIKKSEMVDGDFQWKYGASNIICIKKEACDIDSVENFAIRYARFLYEHKLSGSHRINILNEFPESEFNDDTVREWYDNSIGYYCMSFGGFGSEKSTISIDVLKIQGELRFSAEYDINRYLSRYDNTNSQNPSFLCLDTADKTELNISRLRDYIYDASELNSNLPEETRDFIMVKGKLVSYTEYGYEEEVDFERTHLPEDYKSEMILEGADGTRIKCYLSGSPYDSMYNNIFEPDREYSKIGYTLGKKYNIKELVSKDVVLSGRYIYETNELAYCMPIDIDSVDEYYYSRKKEISDWQEKGIDCDTIINDFYGELEENNCSFPVNFYNKYYGRKVKLNARIMNDHHINSSAVRLKGKKN